jgi:hypothetical protein
MVLVRNAAPGPRVLHLKDGRGAVTLAPGEVADDDFDLTGVAEKAQVDAGELEVGTKAERARKAALDPKEREKLTKERAEIAARLAEIDDTLGSADAGAADRTPPHQFGGDGGPEQMPTVGGRDGAPTPKQEEVRAEEDKQAQERAREDAKAREAARKDQGGKKG